MVHKCLQELKKHLSPNRLKFRMPDIQIKSYQACKETGKYNISKGEKAISRTDPRNGTGDKINRQGHQSSYYK